VEISFPIREGKQKDVFLFDYQGNRLSYTSQWGGGLLLLKDKIRSLREKGGGDSSFHILNLKRKKEYPYFQHKERFGATF